MRFFKNVSVLVMVIFLIAGFDGIAAKEKNDIIKIGMIFPLSGPAAQWGLNMQTILEVSADDINNAGGVKVGGKNYHIEIIPYDDKYLPENALTAANRLIYEDNVNFIFGPMSSSSIIAIQPVTEREKIILFVTGFTRKALSPSKKFTFRIINTPFEFSNSIAAWMQKKHHLSNVVIINPNDETGRENLEGNKIAYEKSGMDVLAAEYYERGTPDMLPLVTRIMRHHPDLIDFSGSSPGDVVNFAKVARAQGYKGLLAKLGGGGDVAAVAAPEALDGYYFFYETDLSQTEGPVGSVIKKMRSKKPGIAITGFVFNTYSSFKLLIKAMQQAKTTTDTVAIKNEIEKMKHFEGLEGELYWGGKDTYGIDHQLLGPIYVGQNIKGVPKVVAKIR